MEKWFEPAPLSPGMTAVQISVTAEESVEVAAEGLCRRSRKVERQLEHGQRALAQLRCPVRARPVELRLDRPAPLPHRKVDVLQLRQRGLP